MSKTCKKRVHGNDKKNLPWDSKKCPGSLHFTLLIKSKFTYNGQRITFDGEGSWSLGNC